MVGENLYFSALNKLRDATTKCLAENSKTEASEEYIM